jgi:hypothetical protein
LLGLVSYKNIKIPQPLPPHVGLSDFTCEGMGEMIESDIADQCPFIVTQLEEI